MKALFFSEKQVGKSTKKGKTVLALFVLKKGEEQTPLHPLAQPFIHEFNDVFPNDLPLDYLRCEALS